MNYFYVDAALEGFEDEPLDGYLLFIARPKVTRAQRTTTL